MLYCDFILFMVHTGLCVMHLPDVLEQFCSFVCEGFQNLWLCFFFVIFERVWVINVVVFVS
jgi:hypothetical protein